MALVGGADCSDPSALLQVVEHGMFVKHCKVEVYLIELKLCENSDLDNVVMRHFSKADTIGKSSYCPHPHTPHPLVSELSHTLRPTGLTPHCLCFQSL